MTFLTEDTIKLLLAILFGALIGIEREYRDKAAGFRTIIFISLGATMFSIFSLRLGGNQNPARIAANVVSGVGFLGAGAILHSRRQITGLTTAATIWLVAAVGMAVGSGLYEIAGASTLIILIVLWLFPKVESLITRVREVRTYEITCPLNLEKVKTIDDLFRKSGLGIKRLQRTKSSKGLVCQWEAHGKPAAHEKLVEKLLAHTDVKQLRV